MSGNQFSHKDSITDKYQQDLFKWRHENILHGKSLAWAPSLIQDDVRTRRILPGIAGAEPSPGQVDWGRPGGGGVDGGASNEDLSRKEHMLDYSL